MLQIKIFTVNPLSTNCLIVWDDGGRDCVLVDPGLMYPAEKDMLLDFLREEGLRVEAVFLTHAHFDHVWGVAEMVRETGCPPVYMGEDDRPLLASPSALSARLFPGRSIEPFAWQGVTDGTVLSAGGTRWRVIATPGHTPGGVCYYCGEAGVLLSGDTLFAGSIGRTDLEGGDYDALIRSVMDRLMGLPGETDVIPGHGQPTSIGREAMTNPFLIPFNEPADDPWWEQDGLELDGQL